MRIRIIIIISFTLFFQALFAQKTSKNPHYLRSIVSLKSGVIGYRVTVKNNTDTLTIYFHKFNRETQLDKIGPYTVWLGKTATIEHFVPNMRRYRETKVTHSDITITFSKPVTSIDFFISHLNNDSSGEEWLQDIAILNQNNYDITDNTSFRWTTGPTSGNDSSLTGATKFDKKVIERGQKIQCLFATKGNYGTAASGRLYIANSIPFTKIEIKQKVISGDPNGVHITVNDVFELSKPQKIENDTIIHKATIVENLNKVTIDTTAQITLPQTAPIQVIDTLIQEKKLTTLDLKDTIVANKSSVDNLQQTTLQETKSNKVLANKTEKKITAPVIKKQSKTIASNKTSVNREIKKTPSTTKTPKLITPKKEPTKSIASVKRKEPLKSSSAKVTKPISSKKKTASTKKIVKSTKPEKVHELKHVANVKVGEIIKLENIFFKQSLSELLPQSYPQLDTLVLILNQYPTMEIEIQGHTDNQGKAELNLKLSEERATAVKEYLVSKGIAVSRLTQKGFGGTRPFVDNGIATNRNQNRRVEFMITKR